MYSQQLTKHFSLSRRCLSPESPRESQRDGGRQGSPRRTRRGGPQCLLAASPVSIAASEAREPRGRRAKEATGTGWTGASTRECSAASAARHKGCSRPPPDGCPTVTLRGRGPRQGQIAPRSHIRVRTRGSALEGTADSPEECATTLAAQRSGGRGGRSAGDAGGVSAGGRERVLERAQGESLAAEPGSAAQEGQRRRAKKPYARTRRPPFTAGGATRTAGARACDPARGGGWCGRTEPPPPTPASSAAAPPCPARTRLGRRVGGSQGRRPTRRPCSAPP